MDLIRSYYYNVVHGNYDMQVDALRIQVRTYVRE
jgi:hypothetical protein